MFERLRKKNPHARLEKDLGYRFKNPELLENALMHRSFRFENRATKHDNQRLEFLGDAVLGLVAADQIYSAYEDGDEGTLTHLRSLITSGKALARIANRINLGEELVLGKGESQSGGRRRESNLADALEAVIGAAYLDGGMKAAIKIFTKLFAPELTGVNESCWTDNPKGRLQELSQRMWHFNPQYRQISEKGPSHAREFVVEVIVNGDPLGTGKGPSKRLAETEAAKLALQRLADDGLV